MPASQPVEPTGEPTADPTVQPTAEPIQHRTPRGVAAITQTGDVVLVELDTRAVTTIASFPPAEAGPDTPVSFFLTDVAVLADGRILLSSCCEPAAGYIRVMNGGGKEIRNRPLYGDDPESDPSGTRLVMTFLQSLVISQASLHGGESYEIAGRGRFSPIDPGWSPDGGQVIFSLVRRLGLTSVSSRSLGKAHYVESAKGTYWGSTAYLRGGPLAVEIDGNPSQRNQGPSRIVRVDFGTGGRSVLVESADAITDLATDRAGRALLWVEGGAIHWRVGGTRGSLAGGFSKAAFLPG